LNNKDVKSTKHYKIRLYRGKSGYFDHAGKFDHFLFWPPLLLFSQISLLKISLLPIDVLPFNLKFDWLIHYVDLTHP